MRVQADKIVGVVLTLLREVCWEIEAEGIEREETNEWI
jgi:hypothetical protein